MKGLEELERIKENGGNAYPERPLSYSSLKSFSVLPVNYLKYCMQTERSFSPAMHRGRVFEKVLFGESVKTTTPPDTKPGNWYNYKKNKDFYSSREDTLTPEDAEKFGKIAANFWGENENNISERSKRFQVQIEGLNFTGEFDAISRQNQFGFSHETIIDVKTIADFSMINKRIKYPPFSYWMQAAIYYQAAISMNRPVTGFFFWFFELETGLYLKYFVSSAELDDYSKRLFEIISDFKQALKVGFKRLSEEMIMH